MIDENNIESAPPWFTRAIQASPESRFVEVEHCPIHYLSWGDTSLPGLLFVGASGGHAHWYDHIAPLFADQFHVVALDLAGCGDSGRREVYSKDLVCREIMAVLSDSGMLDRQMPPIVVGHSAGAQCAVRAVIGNDENILGVIAVDGLRYAELESDHAIPHFRGLDPDAPPPPARTAKVYETLGDATARFRLSPAPKVGIENQFIIEHIARHSFRKVDGGYSTKFDTRQSRVIDLAFELTGALKDLNCHAASLYGQFSHLTDETAGPSVMAMNDVKVAAFTIPGTTHFPQIDSPFAFVSAVKGVALSWIAQANREAG